MKLRLTVGAPLLSPFHRKKLNPLQIDVVTVKDIPEKDGHKYKPIYCITKFVNGEEFRTREFPQDEKIQIDHKHVFLVGECDEV